MKKNSKKPLSVIAGGLIISSLLSGCCPVKDTGSFVGEMEDSLIIEEFVESQAITEEASYVEYELTEEEMFIKYLDEYDLSNLDVDNILSFPEEYSVMDQAAASYYNLKLHGYKVEDVKDELHNIVLHAQVPRCLTEEEFNILVGKLAKTLKYTDNPFSSYLTLARCIHKLECPLKHGLNEFGAFSCKALEDEYNEIYKPIVLIDYIKNLLPNDEDLKELISKLPNTSNDIINEVINECELIVHFGLMPATDIDEESWFRLFGLLTSTLNEDESLFEKYNILALKLHNSLFPDDLIEANEEINFYVRKKEA